MTSDNSITVDVAADMIWHRHVMLYVKGVYPCLAPTLKSITNKGEFSGSWYSYSKCALVCL